MADNQERFSGDMSRNEVEIDLSKFMEMVTEKKGIHEPTRKTGTKMKQRD